MKIIKISSLSCPSCIIMNKIINQLQNKYDVEIENLDYDFDDIEKYSVGKILPVFIFIKNEKEITRLIGEHKIEDFEKIINNQE